MQLSDLARATGGVPFVLLPLAHCLYTDVITLAKKSLAQLQGRSYLTHFRSRAQASASSGTAISVRVCFPSRCAITLFPPSARCSRSALLMITLASLYFHFDYYIDIRTVAKTISYTSFS